MKTNKTSSLILAAAALFSAQSAIAWETERLTVPAIINGHTIPYPVFAIFVLPNDPIEIGLTSDDHEVLVRFAGQTSRGGRVVTTAPAEPGVETLAFENVVTGEGGIVQVITMVPADRVDGNARLNGYRIGAYPDKPLRGLDIYLPPRGFVEVTEENLKTRVSPNFTLSQFVAKQASGYPKYLVLRSSLLLKLENILAVLNRAGHQTEGFAIMSGYRTPFYNRAIGNVPYSRHVWGGAADIYIDDAPADGRMDDLNGDGRVDRADARWLANFIASMSQRGDFGPRIGGLGVYGSTSAHGPFVHIDVRGTRARW